MRVISGEKKGHKLIAPKGNEVRPTEDKVKESFFNIISPIKIDSIILDLFAGTGSIGIEFLSRGSKLAYFVDWNPESIKAIRKNLDHTKYIEKSQVCALESRIALKRFKKEFLKFDYIYVDPPYAEIDLFHEILVMVSELDILSQNGVIVVEHDKKLDLQGNYGVIVKFDHRIYGNKAMTYYKYKEVQL